MRWAARHNFSCRQIFVDLFALRGPSPQPAPNIYLNPPPLFSIFEPPHGNAAHVVQAGQAASLVLAAGEGDFELAAEALRVGMTKQELGACFRVRCHIVNFAAAHTGERTSGHVAHGIAASFTRRNTDSRKPAHQARSRSEEHTSELQSRLHLVCRLLLEKKKPSTRKAI